MYVDKFTIAYDFSNLDFEKEFGEDLRLFIELDDYTYKVLIKNATFSCKQTHLIIDLFKNDKIYFENCKFINYFHFEIRGNLNTLRFYQCSFEKEFLIYSFSQSKIQLLIFNGNNESNDENSITLKNINIVNELEISGLKLASFVFHNDYNEIISDIDRNLKIVIHESNILSFKFSYIGKHKRKIKQFKFSKSDKSNITLNGVELYDFDFNSTTINSLIFINTDIFPSIDSQNFYNHNIKRISFNESNFFDTVNLDGMTLTSLYIYGCVFNRGFSAQKISTTDKLLIVKNDFEKRAYFDKIKVNNLDVLSEETIRTIKQQFQKTDNQIEYDRFKGYELEKHRQAIDWRKDFKDWSILWVSNYYSRQGTNWTRALGVTLFWGLVLFAIFFCIESSTAPIQLNLQSPSRFFNQFFYFLIPIHYNNPLIFPRDIQFYNAWSIIPFVLGKIHVGIGIFETIKSFRKFKI